MSKHLVGKVVSTGDNDAAKLINFTVVHFSVAGLVVRCSIGFGHERGFMMGVQATLFDRLVFDFNFGGGFRHVQTATDNPFGNRLEEDVFASPARTGVSPRIGFQIGVAF